MGFRRTLRLSLFIALLSLALLPSWCSASEPAARTASPPFEIEPAERNFGFGFFRQKGYKDFIEPRVSFVKRRGLTSEAIEYSWRPMQIHDMPHKERIDIIRCSFSKYFFTNPSRTAFFGVGLGGNVILFNQKCKDWAKQNAKIDLKDGVNGLGRFFLGYRLSTFTFGKTEYPVVARFDAFICPDYNFGGRLGHAGEKLELSEYKVGVNFSYE